MKSFDVLRAALEKHVSHDGPLTGASRHASVCVLVAETTPTPHICFIRRAKWDGDPWSEHIAFPGGSRTGDETALQTVRREVHEEVGVSIGEDAELAQLPQLRIRLAGRERLLLLDSFVCHLAGPLPPLQCGPEVASAFWTPVSELWDAQNLDHLALGDQGDLLVYPAVRLPQGMVFGITLRVLTLLSDQLGIPLRYLEEIPMLRRDGKK
ncbi:MAG: CoA pyrophosphatase [Deltaproteobacteria bacterium]|nr:CoA pyrophosphatase [Deltaproteobacteria bacterium]